DDTSMARSSFRRLEASQLFFGEGASVGVAFDANAVGVDAGALDAITHGDGSRGAQLPIARESPAWGQRDRVGVALDSEGVFLGVGREDREHRVDGGFHLCL